MRNLPEVDECNLYARQQEKKAMLAGTTKKKLFDRDNKSVL
jgi:hypothetical protein